MNRYRALVKHQTSGDVFVIETNESGHVYARTYPLHHSEWQQADSHEKRTDLDLDDFDFPGAAESFGDDAEGQTDAEYLYL